jgi:hypothetical protein
MASKSGDFKSDGELIEAIREFVWLRYYLDFETIQFAVPIIE